MILSKKQITVKLNYITPSINASGWKNGINITMETKITDGKTNNKGNMAYREKAKKVDKICGICKIKFDIRGRTL